MDQVTTLLTHAVFRSIVPKGFKECNYADI